MIKLLELIANVMNIFHDQILEYVDTLGYSLNDKQLHFIVIGIIGIIIFVCTQILFKFLSKYSISTISFVYTFTVLLVIVFAIEIEQKLTGRGAMDFADVAYGIYGFLSMFGVCLLFKLILVGFKKLIQKAWNEVKTWSWKDI